MNSWILAINLVLLQIPDVLTTNRILACGGRELNPLMRVCMRLGRGWWVPKMVAATLGSVYLAAYGGADGFWMLTGLNGLYVAVVASNLRQVLRLGRTRGRPLGPLGRTFDQTSGRP